jgi:4-amino-4-deoxy-L-arabinose transferase-like glycosyltransferase
MDGLEIGLNNFFLAFVLYLSIKATPEWIKSSWFLFGTICGLALLSRTDNVIVVGVMLLYLMWRTRNFGPIFKTIATASTLVLPWLAFNYAEFGSFIQNSGTAYPWHYHKQYLREYGSYLSFGLFKYLFISGLNNFFHNAYHYGSWILTLLIAGILGYRLKNWPEKYRPLLWTLAAAVLFASFHTFFRWSVRPWYLQTAFVLTLPMVALSLDSMKRNWIMVGTVLVLLLGLREVWSPPFFRKVDRLKVILDIVNKNIPSQDRVGVYNSGFVQYFTDNRVINLDGLANNEVLFYYKQNKGLEYLRTRNVKWLVDYSFHLWAVFGTYLGAAAESSLATIEIQDNTDSRNNLFIVRVLPDNLRPEPGTEMPIWRGKPTTQLAPIPIPFIREF